MFTVYMLTICSLCAGGSARGTEGPVCGGEGQAGEAAEGGAGRGRGPGCPTCILHSLFMVPIDAAVFTPSSWFTLIPLSALPLHGSL